jgi:hypothetical protein
MFTRDVLGMLVVFDPVRAKERAASLRFQLAWEVVYDIRRGT